MDGVDVVAVFDVVFHVWLGTYEMALDCGLVGLAVGDGSQAALSGLGGEDVVVGIDESGAVLGGQMAVEFSFGQYYPFETAESL